MKYVNETCPVCGELFTAESDVVVCPDCGTPHHRDCYFKIGNCKNAEKHAEDFVWEAQNKPKEETPAKNPEPAGNAIPVFAKGPDAKIPENGIIGEMTIDKDGNQRPIYREIRGNERLGDATVKDYADVIQKNTHKFIPKFMVLEKTGGKVSWNWAAFIFGPYWFAFRKMWKQAFISSLIILIIPFIFMNEIENYYTQVEAACSEFLLSNSFETEKELESAREEFLENVPDEPRALALASYVEVAVDIICGLFGNYLYKQKCESVMAKAKKKSEDSAVRAAYIKKKGGRSIVSVIGFVILYYAIVVVAIAVCSYVGTDIATVLRRYIK